MPSLMEMPRKKLKNTTTVQKRRGVFSKRMRFYRPRSGEIIELVASVRPSVCPFVCMFVRALPAEPAKSKEESLPVQGDRLCVCNQSACAVNHADAVDRRFNFS